jgi:hypothetical protein
MSSYRLLAPLLGAVFLVIAALVGAGAANAHPGHAHPPAVAAAAPAPAAPEVVPSADEAAVRTALTPLAAEPAAGTPVSADIRTASPLRFQVAVQSGRGAPDAPCRGMCCDNSPCGGCVKMAFGKTVLPAPLLGAWVPASRETAELSGRLAEGPNEPPRSFI